MLSNEYIIRSNIDRNLDLLQKPCEAQRRQTIETFLAEQEEQLRRLGALPRAGAAAPAASPAHPEDIAPR